MDQTIDRQVQELMWDVREKTLNRMQSSFDVDLKTSYKDLVTTVDKENERFLNSRLREIDPTAKIISEEGFGDSVTNLAGHVFIVDPIDGTMNFVMQRDNFAIMIGYYEDGKPTAGYIMDVVGNKLYHGVIGQGVFENDHQLHIPDKNGLKESLVVLNTGILTSGGHNFPLIAQQARGLRIYGSAGMEMIAAVKGQIGAYCSYLKPWDLAAGRVLADEIGLTVQTIDGKEPDVLESTLVLVATKQAAEDILALAK